MILTPGQYLRRRRTVTGLSLLEAAARIAVLPWAIRRASEAETRAMALRLAVAEEGGEPFTLAQLQLLTSVIPIDPAVYQQLVAIEAGGGLFSLMVPQLCSVCACSHFTPCGDHASGFCHWVAPDLCSACADTGNPPHHVCASAPLQAEIVR